MLLLAVEPETTQDLNRKWTLIFDTGKVSVQLKIGTSLLTFAELRSDKIRLLSPEFKSATISEHRLILGNLIIFDLRQILGFFSEVGHPREIVTTFGNFPTFHKGFGRIGYVTLNDQTYYLKVFRTSLGYLEHLISCLDILLNQVQLQCLSFDNRIFLFRPYLIKLVKVNRTQICFHWTHGPVLTLNDEHVGTYAVNLLADIQKYSPNIVVE